MENQPYYLAYEKRYQQVFAAGAERWGHSPDDETLVAALEEWVAENNLMGKNIIEFACGEGACGVILSKLGCNYQGVDIAPSAVQKSREALKDYPNARVDTLDMVSEATGKKYDAALDCMGFHMLVTDRDRAAYLKNAYDSLNANSPVLFFRESYRNEKNAECIYHGVVNTYDEWKSITGVDYDTPNLRRVGMGGGDIEVMIPLVPARANDKEGYIKEMKAAGFVLERFIPMDLSSAIQYSASIYVRKP